MDILSFLISAFFALANNINASQSEVSPNIPQKSQNPPGISQSAIQSETVQIAQCLTEKGATFYGAFWCPHCAEQKDQFGEEAMQYITYIECDPRGDNAQPELCLKEEITQYPTWKFPGQQSLIGARDPQELATRAGC